MHRATWLIVGITFLTASAACTPSVNLEQERAALMTADREWSQTTKDPEKFTSYFAEGGSIYPPGMAAVTGAAAIKKTYSEMSTTPGFTLSWSATKAEVATSGDIGVTTGTYNATMGGTSEKGKYVTAWRKQNGTWKVTDDIFNADSMPAPPAGTHSIATPSSIKWGPPPPGLPPGAQVAIISGDPSKPEPYVLRAQAPAGYRIMPHWHPVTENVTVLSGTAAVGMGDTFDASKMQDLPAGGFASLPTEMRHSFMAKTAITIQVHGMGPFGITYVNPADDPRNKKSN